MHKSIASAPSHFFFLPAWEILVDPNLHKHRWGCLCLLPSQCLHVKESIVFFFVYHFTGKNNKLCLLIDVGRRRNKKSINKRRRRLKEKKVKASKGGFNPVCVFKSGPTTANFHTDYISIDHRKLLLSTYFFPASPMP